MTWTAFGADKTGASTITASELNTYLRDNLLFLKAHHDALSEVHGLGAVYIHGAPRAGVRMTAVKAAGTYQGEATYAVDLAWDTAFVSGGLLACIASMELVSATSEVIYWDKHITYADHDGVTVNFRLAGEEFSGVWRPVAIAVGVDA